MSLLEESKWDVDCKRSSKAAPRYTQVKRSCSLLSRVKHSCTAVMTWPNTMPLDSGPFFQTAVLCSPGLHVHFLPFSCLKTHFLPIPSIYFASEFDVWMMYVKLWNCGWHQSWMGREWHCWDPNPGKVTHFLFVTLEEGCPFSSPLTCHVTRRNACFFWVLFPYQQNKDAALDDFSGTLVLESLSLYVFKKKLK